MRYNAHKQPNARVQTGCAVKIVAQMRRYKRPSTDDWVASGTVSCSQLELTARCYADADSGRAAKAGNPSEDPRQPFGDHPFGIYLATDVRWSTTEKERQTYGPVRLVLDPVAGDALVAKQNGRNGLAIHGGPTRDGALRATFGCLRVDDETAEALANAASERLKEGKTVDYICEEVPS